MYSFEGVLLDNMSEIEANGGKLVYPSMAIRPMLQPSSSLTNLARSQS